MKKYLNFLSFCLVGILLGIMLIVVSEFFSFSHVNLVPFGGKSWAIWTYPLALFLGFFASSFMFKVKNKLLILSLLGVCIVVIFSLIFNGNLFVNYIPFGK